MLKASVRFGRAAVTMMFVALLVSCDSKPAATSATPTTPVAEVARIPLAELGAATPPMVVSIAPNAARLAVRVRTSKPTRADEIAAAIDPASSSEILKIYNAATKQWEAPPLPAAENQKLVGIHYSPDGRFQVGLFMGSQPQRDLRVFRMQDQGEMFATKTDLHALAPITFSPDGKSMLHPTPPDQKGHLALAIVNVVSGAVRATLPIDLRTLSHGVFRGMGFTPDGNFVFGHQADHLFVWNATTGQLMTEWTWVGVGDIAAMGCTSDSSAIRALMEEGTIATIDLPAANNVRTGRLNVPRVSPNQPKHIKFETAWSFNRAAFTSDGASIVRDATGQLDIFDMQSGRFARRVALPPNAGPVDFSARQGDLVPVQLRAPGGGSGDSIAIIQLGQ